MKIFFKKSYKKWADTNSKINFVCSYLFVIFILHTFCCSNHDNVSKHYDTGAAIIKKKKQEEQQTLH